MTKKFLLLAMMVMMALALMAPAAFAQDDDDGFDDDGFDDDDGSPAQVAPLPDTGGPAFLIPAAGAVLLGAGVVGVVRRKKD